MSGTLDPPHDVVSEAVRRALAEDLGPDGDVTAALLPAEATATAEVVARAHGVLAGAACVTETYAQLDPEVVVEWLARDGDALEPKAVLARVTGRLRSMLTGERTALNFLCHLSGVATATREFVDRAPGVQIWDTRKTLPGLRVLEKAAVRAGGGVNHRSSLSEMVLVKDNHLDRLGIEDAVRRSRELWPDRKVEVECEFPNQVEAAIAAGADIVMLDNMSPMEAAECTKLIRGSARPDTVIEVSGGVTLENVDAYAGGGVDCISTSAITQSAPALDLALEMVRG
jgi:nicotinate-nucleotide pyrophosphorylase (carboxylating)